MKNFLLILLLIFSVAANAQDKKKTDKIPDLNGTWVLDKSQSSQNTGLGAKPISYELTMTIVQKEPQIEFTRKAVLPNGKVMTEYFEYFTDSRKMMVYGKLDKDNYRIVKWSRRKLVKTDTYIDEINRQTPWFYEKNGVENKTKLVTKEIWEVSEDGNTLTQKITGGFLNGVAISGDKFVYQRKV